MKAAVVVAAVVVAVTSFPGSRCLYLTDMSRMCPYRNLALRIGRTNGIIRGASVPRGGPMNSDFEEKVRHNIGSEPPESDPGSSVNAEGERYNSDDFILGRESRTMA